MSAAGEVASKATICAAFFGEPGPAEAVQAVNRQLACGGTIKAADTMPLEKAAEAHALVESRQSPRATIEIGLEFGVLAGWLASGSCFPAGW
jgi:hypothetical protein